jgi:hypothetical protein
MILSRTPIALFTLLVTIAVAVALALLSQPFILGITASGVDLLPSDPGQFVAGIALNGLD